MTILSDFITDLSAITGTTPINAVVAKPGKNGKAIGITVSDGFHNLGFGNCRIDRPTTIQLDLYDGDYKSLMTQKELIIDRYNGLTLVTPGGTTFKKITVVFSAESASTLNNTVYRVIITIEAVT